MGRGLPFLKYRQYGFYAHGSSRAWCDDCGHFHFVAFFCECREACSW